jgi:signal transduction histidine kinase
MGKVRLRPLMPFIALMLTVFTLVACMALKLVTDTMADDAEHLIVAMVHQDTSQVTQDLQRIQSWSRTGDYIAWITGAIVIVGSGASIALAYFMIFRPVFNLSETMKLFGAGNREVRAKESPCRELAAAADDFNQLADIITEQHGRMLEFLGTAADELRAPLDAMKTALLPFAPEKRLPPEADARSRIDLLLRELDHLDQLVQTYLDSSRSEWKRLDLQLGRQDLCQILRDAATMYRAFSAVHQVAVSVPSEPMWVHTNPARLAQVFHTLVANAIQKSPGGGVVEVVARREGCDAVIDVIDHGIGIPKDEVPHVFDPYPKATQEHPQTPGNSVAMSVARRVVQAHHGGRVEVKSEAGQGSTFRIFLALATDPVREEQQEARSPAGHDGRKGAERKGTSAGEGKRKTGKRSGPTPAPAEARH